ncbi:hypothetical protein ACSBOB_32165 [Mesorhizobium sp. ASY16-5R]|uniref:hypothetical protein n=1 Tax=Mesorhizobium sp. ASY16-5R TaxID=3445772 RepID=UPI003FA06D4E
MAAVVAVAGTASVGAQSVAEVNKAFDELFGGHAPYQNFFDALKKAVASDDKAAVAAMVDYPFQARIGGKAVKIRDAAHFVADYDKIVTAKVKQAVAKQSYATLFANWQGVCIGDGEIWFSGVGDANLVRITAIND